MVQAHDTSEISRGVHDDWLAATLASARRALYIAQESGCPVGTVRVDRGADGVAELSWTVAPDARGKGVATRMLRIVADEIVREFPVRAEIKLGNEASIKVAEAAGMRLIAKKFWRTAYYRDASFG